MRTLQRGVPWLVLAVAAACGPAPEGDPGFWRPIARADATAADPDPGPDPDPGSGGAGGATTGGAGGAGGAGNGTGGAASTGGSGGSGGSPVAGRGGAGVAGTGGSGAGTGGAGGVGGAGGTSAPTADAAAPPSGPSATCTLAVTVTTVTTNRDYAPDNIGAVWIADAGGKFVKSLAVWANRRIQHLYQWNMSTSAAAQPRNRVDAVSGATAGNHNARTVSWNCTDFARKPVADGDYQVCYEMTESNSSDNNPPTRYQCVRFTKGPMGFESMPADAAGFRARRLRFVP